MVKTLYVKKLYVQGLLRRQVESKEIPTYNILVSNPPLQRWVRPRIFYQSAKFLNTASFFLGLSI